MSVNTSAHSTGSYNQAISQINKHIVGIWERENLYPQKLGSGSERSDADIWKHLDVHVWGKEYVDQHTGKITAGNPSAIVPQFQSEIATVQLQGQTQRDRIEEKLDKGIAEHQIFYDLHTEQEGRISDKAAKGHSHNGDNGLDWYVKLALVAAGAFLVYFIIRRKFLK